jgi:integrase
VWVFPSDRRPGQHLTKLNCTHDRICREAGVCFVMYDCRHTFATRMIAAGVDVPTVAAIMGHSGLRTIYRYVHPTAEAQRMAMERFDAAQNRAKLRAM